MRASRTSGAADLMMILIVLLSLGAAGTGGYAYMLWQDARLLQRKLPQAETDFKKAIGYRDDLRDMQRSGSMANTDEVQGIQSFFHQTAQEYKFAINKISPTKGRYKDQWDEQMYRLEIKVTISRQQLGNFLADVQQKKPFLKTKEIRDIKFDENHFITSVTIVFSHYSRIRK